MATTMKLIAKTVLGSTSNTIDFQSIPAFYDDLLLVMSARADYNDGLHYAVITFKYNNSGGSAYSNRRLVGTNSADSYSNTGEASHSTAVAGSSATSDTFSSIEIYVPNYAGSTNKSSSLTGVIATNSAANMLIGAVALLWADTSAINRITFTASTGNFVAGTSAYLYGITKS